MANDRATVQRFTVAALAISSACIPDVMTRIAEQHIQTAEVLTN